MPSFSPTSSTKSVCARAVCAVRAASRAMAFSHRTACSFAPRSCMVSAARRSRCSAYSPPATCGRMACRARRYGSLASDDFEASDNPRFSRDLASASDRSLSISHRHAMAGERMMTEYPTQQHQVQISLEKHRDRCTYQSPISVAPALSSRRSARVPGNLDKIWYSISRYQCN